MVRSRGSSSAQLYHAVMSHLGSPGEDGERAGSLKRKRNSTDDEDLENMPPAKISSKSEEDDRDSSRDLVLEAPSSYESPDDEDVAGCVTVSARPAVGSYDDDEYSPDTPFSPTVTTDLPSGILSPLENVPRGDSTPHSTKRQGKPEAVLPVRKCPFPGLSWADPSDVWKRMCECDARSTRRRDPNMFDKHPNLEPRMRAILFDWLNEVCEVYKLHRETFYLTVDYVDRFLSNTKDTPKGQLQLIGITCLFIAAKVEEVYPPKIGEFAYVTDRACTTEEILIEEVYILKVLSWSITPITINGWLNVYMQLASEARGARRRLLSETDSGVNSLRGYTFVFPQYSSLEFVICGQLIDLAVLHVGAVRFPYSVIAAAAMAHTFNKDLALRVSGYKWEDVEECCKWLQPFASVLREEGAVSVTRALPDGGGEFMQGSGGLALICPDINLDESHRIQVHNISLDMFDKVSEQLNELTEENTVPPVEETPKTAIAPLIHVSPLTPPQSDQKDPKTPTAPTPSTSIREYVTDIDEDEV